MILAEIILPLAVEGTYTYRLPDDCPTNPQPGMRVLVPLGRKKVHTGIIRKVVDTRDTDGAYLIEGSPSDSEQQKILQGERIKEILCFLDSIPLVTELQMRLWEWIADYYMCTIGEVMKAALPSALKLESETRICLNPDYEAAAPLPRNAQAILDALADGKPKNLDEIARIIEVRSAASAVSALLDMGAIFAEEHVEDRYAAKTEHRIRLADSFSTPGAELPKLGPKQQELLRTFFQMQDEAVLQDNAEVNPALSRTELLKRSGCNAAQLKALVEKGILTDMLVTVDRLAPQEGGGQALPTLNEAQQTALDEIHASMLQKKTTLLYGVTSSGKTEIYIRLIDEQLKRGKQVLYLVPEIALTTQLTDRLRRVFGARLGVYHSKFSDRERVEIYRNVLMHKSYDVIIGVRSSLFLPFSDLGLIIVDEEHDGSYKQQDPAPRYHARSAAIVLANMLGAHTLLGTATPAVETFYNAQIGKFGLVRLTQRYRGLSLPEIQIIDLKRQYHRKEMRGHFSDPLHDAIHEELGKGKQIIIFQNRRGYSSYVECKQCTYVPKCVNCDVSLTEHRFSHTLSCHYCGYTIPIPTECPACKQQGTLADRGFGTEMIEDEVNQLFPLVQAARMDLDTTRNKNGHQRIISRFANHEIDILIGTQMVTKGLHFDDVSLVAVLKADALLNQPDFRAAERAYQMLEQVAGRAGRAGDTGQVIIQTADPEHPIFRHLAAHDYDSFYMEQIQERETFKYPPFHRVICINLRHHEQSRLESAARTLQERLTQSFGSRCSAVIVPQITRIQNQYNRQIVLKIEAEANYQYAKHILRDAIRYACSLGPCKGTVIQCDVDPM